MCRLSAKQDLTPPNMWAPPRTPHHSGPAYANVPATTNATTSPNKRQKPPQPCKAPATGCGPACNGATQCTRALPPAPAVMQKTTETNPPGLVLHVVARSKAPPNQYLLDLVPILRPQVGRLSRSCPDPAHGQLLLFLVPGADDSEVPGTGGVDRVPLPAGALVGKKHWTFGWKTQVGRLATRSKPGSGTGDKNWGRIKTKLLEKYGRDSP